MPKDFVLSVMSRDRPGIVAGLTEAITELNGNIDAISQTVLQGYFTIILTVRFDASVEPAALMSAVRESAAPGELEVSVKEHRVLQPEPAMQEADRFVLTIQGADRKGIIRRVSSYLSSRNVNIEDLYAYAHGGQFLLIAQLQVPRRLAVEHLRTDMEAIWPEEQMRVSLQHEDVFLATSHVDFRQRVPKAPKNGRQGR